MASFSFDATVRKHKGTVVFIDHVRDRGDAAVLWDVFRLAVSGDQPHRHDHRAAYDHVVDLLMTVRTMRQPEWVQRDVGGRT